MEIRSLIKNDFAAVSSIYLEGIKTGMATFETEVPTWEKWNASHLPFGRMVMVNGGEIVGWAAMSPTSNRSVYKGVAEVSVYVKASARGKGVGKALLLKLIKISEENGIWTLQSSIMPENTTSKNLHINCGFREIGYREKIGKLYGEWKDNIILERRSKLFV
ncbi:GNAT family N-acetyltransferase [Galbibacter sp. EGI 63066]|uniref:GNAT family N-acetyltransferase n=1 Tax=Galbibacter sp. EGI 63066 TaxID=2993559 RepID=UPI00224910DB|nr:GNAT family N-acetyltransferase [Galbibacter sp. EGI 63066]MCX2681721.1 GNAT family N-acetyltransferase [Galbibacter sp. EGI 63066]